MVAETLRLEATLSEFAHRHGLKSNRASSWGTMTRNGKLVLPAPEYPAEFETLKDVLHNTPFTGRVFVFRAKKTGRLKLFYCDRTGLVLAYERFKEHSFTSPTVDDGLITLSRAIRRAVFWARLEACSSGGNTGARTGGMTASE